MHALWPCETEILCLTAPQLLLTIQQSHTAPAPQMSGFFMTQPLPILLLNTPFPAFLSAC